MGAKGLVLNHSMIAWKQTPVYFRGFVKQALSLSDMLSSGQALGQESLFSQPGRDHKLSSCKGQQSSAAPRKTFFSFAAV